MKTKRNKNKTGSGRQSETPTSSSQGSDAMHDGRIMSKSRSRTPKGQSTAEAKRVKDKAPKLRSRTVMSFSKSTVASRNKLVKRSSSALSDKLVKVPKTSPKKWKALKGKDGKQNSLKPTVGHGQENNESAVGTDDKENKSRYFVKSRNLWSHRKRNRSSKRDSPIMGEKLCTEDEASLSRRRENRNGARWHVGGENPVATECVGRTNKVKGYTLSSSLSSSETDHTNGTENEQIDPIEIRTFSQGRISRGTLGRFKPKPSVSSSKFLLTVFGKKDIAQQRQSKSIAMNKETCSIQKEMRGEVNMNEQLRDVSPRIHLTQPVTVAEHVASKTFKGEKAKSLYKNVTAQSMSTSVHNTGKKTLSQYSTTSDEIVKIKTKPNPLREETCHVIPCCYCCHSSTEDACCGSSPQKRAICPSSDVSFIETEAPEDNENWLEVKRLSPEVTNLISDDKGVTNKGENQQRLSEERIHSPPGSGQREDLSCASPPVVDGDASDNKANPKIYAGAKNKGDHTKFLAYRKRQRERLFLSKSFKDHLRTVVEYQALLSQNMRCLMAELDRIGARRAETSLNYSSYSSSSESGPRNIRSQTGGLKVEPEDLDEKEKLGKVQQIVEAFENRCKAWSPCTNRTQHTQTDGCSVDSTGDFTDKALSSGSSGNATRRKNEKSPSLDSLYPSCQPQQPWLALQELQSISVQTENIQTAANSLRHWRYTAHGGTSFPQAHENTPCSLLTDLLSKMDAWKEKLSISGVFSDHPVRRTGRDAHFTATASRSSLSTTVDGLIKLPYCNRNCSSCVPESPDVWGNKRHRLKYLTYPSRQQRNCRTVNSYRNSPKCGKPVKPSKNPHEDHRQPIQVSSDNTKTTENCTDHLHRKLSSKKESWRAFYLQSAMLLLAMMFQFVVQVALTRFRD